MPQYEKQFRDIFYKSSLPFGDVMSFGILNKTLGSIRNSGLHFARINADLKSLQPSGQGPSLRIQRRIAGRISGKIGHLIPQKLGPVTRIANRTYGKFATKKVQNYYNWKMGFQMDVSGRLLSDYAKAELMKTSGKKLTREYEKVYNQWNKKMDIESFNLPKFMQDIQFNLLGYSSSIGAPVATGNLRNSIRLRRISFLQKGALAKGVITIGQSQGKTGKEADQAPYWWKTVYGGYYDEYHKNFRPARNRGWLGKGLMNACLAYFPKADFQLFVNGVQRDDLRNYMSYQPKPPTIQDFELCHLNGITDPTGFLEYLASDDEKN